MGGFLVDVVSWLQREAEHSVEETSHRMRSHLQRMALSHSPAQQQSRNHLKAARIILVGHLNIPNKVTKPQLQPNYSSPVFGVLTKFK